MKQKKKKTDSEKLFIVAQAYKRFGLPEELEDLIDDENLSAREQELCREALEILAAMELEF